MEGVGVAFRIGRGNEEHLYYLESYRCYEDTHPAEEHEAEVSLGEPEVVYLQLAQQTRHERHTDQSARDEGAEGVPHSHGGGSVALQPEQLIKHEGCYEQHAEGNEYQPRTEQEFVSVKEPSHEKERTREERYVGVSSLGEGVLYHSPGNHGEHLKEGTNHSHGGKTEGEDVNERLKAELPAQEHV